MVAGYVINSNVNIEKDRCA